MGRDVDARAEGLSSELLALGDGCVHVDDDRGVGFLRVGPATFHPAASALRAAVTLRQSKSKKPQDNEGLQSATTQSENVDNGNKISSQNPFSKDNESTREGGFWLCFGLDPGLTQACEDAGNPFVLAQLCAIGLVEPTDLLPEDAQIVVVGSAHDHQAISRAEALRREDLGILREVLASHRVILRNARPVGNEATARELVARLAELAPDLEDPIVVVADRGALLGAWSDDCADEDACTLISSDLPTSMRADGQLTTQLLASTFQDDGKDVFKMEATATYELLGNVADTSGCVTLLAKWAGSRASPCRLLSPPALIPSQAFLLVRGTNLDGENVPSDRASASFLPDSSLIVLNQLHHFTPETAINLDVYEPDATWARRVQEFFRSAVSGTLFSRVRSVRNANSKAANGDDDGDMDIFQDQDEIDLNDSDLGGVFDADHRMLKPRTNLDFTEHLWTMIIARANKLEDIMYALRELVTLLDQGRLLPYIHKSNMSMLGVICRHVVQRQANTGANSVDSVSNGAQTFASFSNIFAQHQIQPTMQAVVVKHLIRLGTFKLKRDFEGWFSEIGMEMPSLSTDATQEGADAIPDLVRLRNALQTVATALAVQCPLIEAKQLAQACLCHENAKTFLVPLRSQLPWVKGDASLPTARSWQLEQHDKQGEMVQTSRLTPLVQFDLPSLENVVPVDAARKAVSMLDSEPDGILRSMISYPASIGSSMSSSSASQMSGGNSSVNDDDDFTTLASRKCMCIQTRRLCLT